METREACGDGIDETECKAEGHGAQAREDDLAEDRDPARDGEAAEDRSEDALFGRVQPEGGREAEPEGQRIDGEGEQQPADGAETEGGEEAEASMGWLLLIKERAATPSD